MITVQKFKNGNRLYPAPADYIRGNGEDKQNPAGKTSVLGVEFPIYERFFEDSESSFDSPSPATWKVREMFMVWPSTGAYYVVSLRAQEKLFPRYKDDFLSFLKTLTFHPASVKK